MRRSLATISEERRGLTLSAARVEVRADENGDNPRFGGHAAVFNSRTAIGNPLTWGFYEEIASGAFTKTLNEGDARFLIDHDPYYVVARVSADTLDLAQDKVGLKVDAALDTELSYVRDLVANLRNGNITGMSFGFYVVKDEWDVETVETSDGQSAEVEVRRILEAKLIEVSAVTFPAYEDTDAGLRALVIPALRSRGDAAAIARRTQYRPELVALLNEVAPARAAADAAPDVPAPVAEPTVTEVPATEPVDATDTDTTETTEDVEPGETTPDASATDETNNDEPAETTRDEFAPSETAIRRARMTALAARYGLAKVA